MIGGAARVSRGARISVPTGGSAPRANGYGGAMLRCAAVRMLLASAGLPLAAVVLVCTFAVACASHRAPATARGTARRAGATAAWLAPFADALRFVPPGMQSHWLCDHRALRAADGARGRPGPLLVHAGRGFTAPARVGIGAFAGVSVEDHGEGGMPGATRNGHGERRPPIGGAEVWHRPDAAADPFAGPWTARVGDRFVVRASSEELLRAALARSGTGRFGALEPLPAIDPSTTDLVLRDLAGEPPPANAFPCTGVPGVAAVAAVRLTPPVRIRAWGATPDVRGLVAFCWPAHQGWIAAEVVDAAMVDTDRGALRHTLDVQPPPGAEHEAAAQHTGLMLACFFGAWLVA
jgi:hypothetical protein